MISNVHYIELFIKGQLMELVSQDSLNLRMNNVLFNPTKTTTKQAEYSYSFDLPSTPNNDKVLGYANNLSRENKFHARYSAQVYSDGIMIFDGSLTVQKYSAKNKMYTCNLVNIKISTLEEIFGDMKMTDLKWMVDFDGASTINDVNSTYSTKYFFPLVSYGVFQKDHVTKDEVGASYTPKHTIDKYNKWWVESFYPSLNVIETMKKALESKGYGVIGSALRDPYISEIYASTNLAQDQDPIYNIGNPKFGRVNVSVNWNNYESERQTNQQFGATGRTFANSTGGLPQTLNFPYEKVTAAINASNGGMMAQDEYNFDTILFWNMLDKKNNDAVQITVNEPTYMYDPTEMLFVIPADGWYKIYLSCNATLSGAGSSFSAQQWTTTFRQDEEMKQRNVSLKRNFRDRTPFEIQLIRNYDDNIELIKGKKNVKYATGDPNQETYTYIGGSYTGGTYANKTEWLTECPHQDPYGSESPTKTSDMINQTIGSRNSVLIENGSGNEYSQGETYQGHAGSGTFGGSNHSGGSRRAAPSKVTTSTGTFGGARDRNNGGTKYNTYGFMHQDNQVMPYDQAVSTAFICGMSTMSDGTLAVMKDGYSWSKLSSVRNRVFADVKGLDLVNKKSDGGTEVLATNYCKNTYNNSTFTLNCSDSNLSGVITCCVYLNKNDVLELVAVQRDYDGQQYSVSAHCDLQITAMSDRSQEELKGDPTWGYNSTTEFPTQLNLFNFTNAETKVSDWINNIQTALNLEIIQDGGIFEINTNQGIKKNIQYAVDIDDRVSSYEAESEYISYPRQMSVQYKIDTEEWGFELSVPAEHINDEGDEWKKWGDSGFTIINLSDDSYETSTQNVTTQFSYTWYDNFTWKEVYQDRTESPTNIVQRAIPVISKAEYMAEGYGYDEAMKHDGYSLTQRFWFRDQTSLEYVWLSSYMPETIDLVYPKNIWEGFNLSYKDTEKSIVTEYFNISPMLSSNYVNLDVYLNPDEYNAIKGGALIHFDSDLYYISEINGYDPSGCNRTQLKLIKKV